MLKRAILPALFLVVCTSLHADVTMRMALEMKINVAIPNAAPPLPFNEMLTRIKGTEGYAAIGPIVAITDIAGGKVTLLDVKGQHFATIPMADYVSTVTANGKNTPNLPEEAKQILAQIKFDTESRDTGRTERIQGIEAYEREVMVNVSIPVPIPGQEQGLHIRMRFQIWKPKASEFERVPALRELAAYNDRNKGFGDPATVLRQAFGTLPGMGDHIGQMVEEITKGGNVMLGMRVGVFIPGLAKIVEQATKAQSKDGAAPALPALPAGSNKPKRLVKATVGALAG